MDQQVVGDGFQIIDIVFFAMIAVFLVLRLRSVLGRRDGYEEGNRGVFPAARSKAQPKAPPKGQPKKQSRDNVVKLPARGAFGADDDLASEIDEEAAAEESPLAAGFKKIKKADSRFDQEEFVSGAKIAFEIILNAYAAGEIKVLKPMLNAEVFGNFTQSIKDREQAKETLEETLVGIKKAEALEAYMEDSVAHITIKFVSDQINATRDEKGEVISGNPDYVAEITDFWTFARDTKSRDPNWLLVATRSLD